MFMRGLCIRYRELEEACVRGVESKDRRRGAGWGGGGHFPARGKVRKNTDYVKRVQKGLLEQNINILKNIRKLLIKISYVYKTTDMWHTFLI